MRTIKVKFSGFWGKFSEENNFIIDILRRHFNVIISDKPEYLFYSVFSKDFLNYDCVRIFYTGENLCPDFNLCDYGIGFSYLDFGDRYIRFPQYLVSDYSYYLKDNYKNDLELAKSKHIITDGDSDRQKGFCSFVYSNSDADPFREKFYNALSNYKKVDSGGRFNNNVGGPVEDKLEFQKNYKFSIAFENSSTTGYTTEKIVQSFAAKTIPIYWGNPEIGREFNEGAFINCHRFSSIDEIIKYIVEIDNNLDEYNEIMSQKAFCDNYCIDEVLNELEKFLLKIVDQDYDVAFRRNRCYWGKRYEKKMKIGSKFYNLLMKGMPVYSFIKRR